jgi:hypothetical protein
MSTTVAYSQNDFFYSRAENNGKMPSDGSCNSMNINNSNWDISCNDMNFVDNSGNCINRELCLNKQNSNLINGIQSKNSGSLEKYENSKQVFNKTILTSINLGIGIIALVILIYKNRSAT